MNRQAEITINVGCEVKLTSFRSTEKLGELFEIDARVVASQKVDFLLSIGKKVLIEVFEADKPVRVFNALLAEADYLDDTGEGYGYSLKLRPWLYALAHNRTYRIFENMTGVDIIKNVLADHSRLTDYSRISGSYRPRIYTTQYRESDFQFISRIMEREGIYYYFEHRRDDHVLVLCDAPSAHMTAPGYEAIKLRPDKVGRKGGLAGAIWRWHEHVRDDGQRRFALQSFDYETSSTKTGEVDGGARNPADTQDVYTYTGDFVEEALAGHWAKVASEAAKARQRLYSGEGDMIGVFCGCRFKLDSKDAFDRGDEFVITALDYSINAEPFRSGREADARRVVVEAVTRDTRWRSPITTPMPRAGPETAIVMVGGADDTNVDDLGRIRVRFLWGQAGDAPDKARSCWLRISSPSAGSSFGHVTFPRLDEEVIVTFLDGNPDRPIVTGCVYNSKHPHPYPLPEHRTRSLYRSQSIGPSGSYAGAKRAPRGVGYNELMFEDKGGAEQVYLRAQRDRLTEVMLDDETRVMRDRKDSVYRNKTTTVETGDAELKVKQGSVTIEATKRITLRVGQNMMVIDPTGIHCTAGPSRVDLTPASMILRSPIIIANAQLLQTMGMVTLIQGQLITIRGTPTLIVPSAFGPWLPIS
ncbi:type VI secretion system Vgr family protein [Sphingomonas arantia]|uniref:Type VI secretion system Vgr family protein n=1 Tax=Sphingomonas arantia TaxID=1460676 RepID=A0ABW4U2P2_9SPHN